MRVFGKFLDTIRVVFWVRRFDVVVVPGMGILEESLPLRPWGFPYALFLVCASGRLFGTRTALVSVGADVVHRRLNRWLITRAARLAHYRSYRDHHSKDAMESMGIDTSRDEVYPDLAFALSAPATDSASPRTVGVGLMAYYGGNDDKGQADEIYARYVRKMKRFVLWLVDGHHQVRLFTGDRSDEVVVTEVLADIRASRPDIGPSRLIAEPVSSLTDLIQKMSLVDVVVATRYHNVLCALKLSKPTVSIGYAAKNDVLMAQMGLGEFCQSVSLLDVDLLMAQFTALESQGSELRHTMVEQNLANVRRIDQLFKDLSVRLFDAPT